MAFHLKELLLTKKNSDIYQNCLGRDSYFCYSVTNFLTSKEEESMGPLTSSAVE